MAKIGSHERKRRIAGNEHRKRTQFWPISQNSNAMGKTYRSMSTVHVTHVGPYTSHKRVPDPSKELNNCKAIRRTTESWESTNQAAPSAGRQPPTTGRKRRGRKRRRRSVADISTPPSEVEGVQNKEKNASPFERGEEKKRRRLNPRNVDGTNSEEGIAPPFLFLL